MITINQLEARYHSLCKLRLYLLSKLREAHAKDNYTKYSSLVVKINNTDNNITLFEHGIKQIRGVDNE